MSVQRWVRWRSQTVLAMLLLVFSLLFVSAPLLAALGGGAHGDAGEPSSVEQPEAKGMEQGGFVLAAVAGHGHQAGVLSKHSIADVQVLLEEFIQVLYWRFDILFTANMAKAPYDLYQAMDRISQGGGNTGFYRMFRVLVVVFALAVSVEFLLRRFVLSRLGVIAPEGDRLHLAQRLWLLWMQAIPEGISLIFFVAASYYFYVQIYADFFSGICPLFLSLLTMVLVARGITLVSSILFSCGDGRIRVLPLGDVNSKVAHRCVQLLAWIVAGGSLCVSLFEHAGLQGDSKLTLRLFFGSLYIMVLLFLLHLQRKRISTWLQEGGDGGHGPLVSQSDPLEVVSPVLGLYLVDLGS